MDLLYNIARFAYMQICLHKTVTNMTSTWCQNKQQGFIYCYQTCVQRLLIFFTLPKTNEQKKTGAETRLFLVTLLLSSHRQLCQFLHWRGSGRYLVQPPSPPSNPALIRSQVTAAIMSSSGLCLLENEIPPSWNHSIFIYILFTTIY